MRSLAFVALILVAGCGAHDDAATAAPAPAAPAPALLADASLPDAAPPAPAVETSHTIVHGDTLDAIALARYGSRHYSRLIALADKVDPTKLKVGATLALPPLDAIAAPVARRAPDATAALLRAQATWRTAADALWAEHRRTRKISARPEVARAAADVELARAAFAKAGAPTKTLASLHATLAGIADGHIDPEGYALDDADRRFADGLAALVTWARR